MAGRRSRRTTVAFVVTRIDEDANDYRSQIWLVPTDGSGPPWPFSSGDHKDANPTWSPQGGRLAFTSERGDPGKASTTLHVAPVGSGGEIIMLARLPESAGGLRWSPDGRLIAFTTRTRAERYAEDDERKQPPRRVTRLFSRLDNTGFTVDRPEHTYVVPADGSAVPRNMYVGVIDLGGGRASMGVDRVGPHVRAIPRRPRTTLAG